MTDTKSPDPTDPSWVDDLLNLVWELGQQIAEEGPEIVARAERFNLCGDEHEEQWLP